MARTAQIIVKKRTFMVALDGALVFIAQQRERERQRDRGRKEGGLLRKIMQERWSEVDVNDGQVGFSIRKHHTKCSCCRPPAATSRHAWPD
jgi:hypothetical protein